MADAQAVVSRRRRIPAIWFVPIVAGLLGLWVVIYTMMTEGPTVRIRWATAEGIEAGKTKVKSRSVELGLVEEVLLNDDLHSVTVVAKLDPRAEVLLREDTRFWVVRPRLGAGGISGIGTIMSGAYIELQPGPGEPIRKRKYAGLEDPPVTPVDAPGLWLTLVGARAGSLGVGQPVLFRGFPVGRLEERRFDVERRELRYTVFIEEPYQSLVDKATRFWNASGISMSASADGVRIDVSSLQTILSGGVAFDVPKGNKLEGPVSDGAEFKLYDDEQSTGDLVFDHALEVIVEFQQSLRGLAVGAPVEYRGLPVGNVERILFDAIHTGRGGPPRGIPVLIRIEPARLGGADDEESVEVLARDLVARVDDYGLRATLETGNLITGNLFVSLDFFPGASPATVGQYGDYVTIPSIASGLEGLGRQVSSVLAKIDDLPLDRTVDELNRTLGDLRRLVGSDAVEELPSSVNASLAELSRTLESFSPGSPMYDRLDRAVTELTRTLQSVEDASRTITEQPNAVIFDKPIELDPEPRGVE